MANEDIASKKLILENTVEGGVLSSCRLQEKAGYQLRILSSVRRIIRAIEINSRKLVSQHNITGPQLDCLLAVANYGPLSTTSLARQVVLSPSTVVGILDRLERKGLVTRRRDTADRRIVRIAITDTGAELAAAAPSSFMMVLSQSLETMSSEEQDALTEALERLVEHMEPGSIPLQKSHSVL